MFFWFGGTDGSRVRLEVLGDLWDESRLFCVTLFPDYQGREFCQLGAWDLSSKDENEESAYSEKPYSASWFGCDDQVIVRSICLLTMTIMFSTWDLLGEHIWCDKVPMSVTQIILGRPWIYDNGNTHDMWRNAYTFLHRGLASFCIRRWRFLECDYNTS